MRHRALALIASALLVAGLAGPANAAATVKVAVLCLPGTMVGDYMAPTAYGPDSNNDFGLAIALSGRSTASVTAMRIDIDGPNYAWTTEPVGFYYWLGVFTLSGTPAAGADTADASFDLALGGKPMAYVVRGDLPGAFSAVSGLTADVTVTWSNGGVAGSSSASCVIP